MENKIKQSGKYRTFISALQVLIFSIFIIFILRSTTLDFYYIPSKSMEPTLMSGDFVIVSKLSYFVGLSPCLPFFPLEIPNNFRLKVSEIKRKDLIAFFLPFEDRSCNPMLVKRVVAKGGDTVLVYRNKTIIYFEGIENSPVAYYYNDNENIANPNTADVIIIPKQGDTLSFEKELNDIQLLLLESDGAIIEFKDGKILIDDTPAQRYVFKNNFYFVLGDNINYSRDSRFFGLIPEGTIVGKPLFIYWSFGSSIFSEEKKLRLERIFKMIN